MKSVDSKEFGRFRSLFCPVHKHELRLFLPLFLIFFFICFSYNVLRTAKDTLVVTAPSSGAEILPFIKVWVVLPMALVMTVLFTRLANRFSTEKVFYIMMGIFLGFFLVFTTVMYPLRDVLHPNAFADKLQTILPFGLRGLIALIRNWTYTTFYLMAELWGTTIMTVLFWGFANEILNVNTAKRFYVLILIGGNLSAICAGIVSTLVSNMGLLIGQKFGIDPWQVALLLMTSLVVFNGGIVILIFRWLHMNTLNNQEHRNQIAEDLNKKELKMSLRSNFSYLARSKYLMCIAAIVLAYNVCINLTEVMWKHQLLNFCPDPLTFNAYMGKVTMSIGILATIIALISSALIRKVSWTFSAMIPPVILLITGAGFFTFLIFKNTPAGILLASILGFTPSAIGLFFGSAQQALSRASKYTIFDATKELAFIPLSKESKLKGKAAIDGVGSRLGKSGSALIYQVLIIFLGTVGATLPYVALILCISIIAWIVAVSSLGKQFNTLTEQREKESTDPLPQVKNN